MMRLLAALAAATGVDAASDGLARRPMRGWNSWNWVGVAGCDDACAAAGMAGRCHSEVVMRQMTDVVAGGKLKELDYEYINLSEGWPAECFRTHNCTCVVCRSDLAVAPLRSCDSPWHAGSGRFPNGTIMHDPDRYPSGIKALADYVHQKGLKFGICALNLAPPPCPPPPPPPPHTQRCGRLGMAWGGAGCKGQAGAGG